MVEVSGVHKSRLRDCVVCGEKSFGKKHRDCEFESTRGSKGSLSKLHHSRRNKEKRDANKRQAASNLLLFAGLDGVCI